MNTDDTNDIFVADDENEDPIDMVEETYRIQLDPEYVDLNVCIWGPDGHTTGAAVERFLERYLAEYLHQVHEMIADAD